MTIQQILDFKHTQYLRWVYFNFEGIDFNDEVKLKVGLITKSNDWSIKKPGIDSDAEERLNKLKFMIMANRGTKEENTIAVSKSKNITNRNAKIKIRKTNAFERIKYSKSNMQRINQGK